MGETMSFSSLVLMLGVALLYQPVFRRLQATPDAWPRSSWGLWVATLPFALLSWGAAYLWSQAPHSPSLSLSVILGVLALFWISYGALLGATRRRLGRLGLLLAGLLAYTGICWAVTSLWAALGPTTIEGQALLLGYLLLGPTLVAILLPRSGSLTENSFILLGVLLLYAAAAWATVAFRGIFPTPPQVLKPVLAVFVWLVVFGVVAWILQRLLATPVGITAGRAAVTLAVASRRLPSTLQSGIRYKLPALWIVLRGGVQAFRHWLVAVLMPGVGRNMRAAAGGIWSGCRAIALAIWRALVALGRGAGRAAVWLVAVAPRSIARGLLAATRGICSSFRAIVLAIRRGLVTLGHGIVRAIIWLVTIAPRAIAVGLLAAAHGIRGGFRAIVLAIWCILLALGRGARRATVWLVTVAPRSFARGLLTAAQGTRHGFVTVGRSLWRGLLALGYAVSRTAVWLVTVVPRSAVSGIAGVARAVGRGALAVVCGAWRGLVALAHALARAGTWVAAIGLPAIGHAFVAAARVARHGFLALMRAIRHGFVAAARALGQAAVWLVAVAVPGIGHGLVAGVRAIGRGFLALMRAIRRGLVAAARALGQAAVWLVAVAVPGIGHGLVAGVHAVGRGLVALMLAFGRAPSRFAGQIRKFGRGIAGVARAVMASLLALARWLGRSVARLVTVVIPDLAHRSKAGAAAGLALFSRTPRSLTVRQTPARGKTVMVGGTVLVIAAAFAAWGTLSNRDTFAPASPTPTPLPPNSVGITIVTNDTKAEWLGLVTEAFNKSTVKTSAGHQIVVQMIQESSPGPTVKKIVAGELQPVLWSPSDISWIDQANQLLKDLGQGAIVKEECPPVVYVPTGFVMWRPMAEALGWPDKPIGWKQIVELADDPQGWAKYGHPEWGQFTFGHTHPEQSSTGFNILASLAYAAAGETSALTPAEVKSAAVVDAFSKLEKDTYHYGLSTRGLLTLMGQHGPGYLHAASSSETAFIKNEEVLKSELIYPWAFIFPSEGVFWSDNPTCILQASWVSPEQREAAGIYRDFLLAPPQQDKAVQIGLRPAAPGIALHCPICLQNGTDPRVTPETVPPLASVSGETNAAIIDVFKETKKNVTVILVLDSSVSMAGDKLRSAVAATSNFISRLAPADRVQLYAFNNGVAQVGPSGAAAEVRDALPQALKQVRPGGQTALNDAICAAVQSAEAARAQDRAAGERRLYGVAVLSDGAENRSKQKDVFACLPKGEDVEGVKVFTIAYGKDADAKLLKKIAERANGKTFTADPATIDQVYLTISAEQ